MITEKPDYPDIPYELESRVVDEVKAGTKELVELLAKHVNDIVWQIADGYIENHLGSDVISNYEDRVRQEIVRCSYVWMRKKDCFWGKSIRAKMLEEHKDELVELIKHDKLRETEKEIADLKEEIEKLKQYNRKLEDRNWELAGL